MAFINQQIKTFFTIFKLLFISLTCCGSSTDKIGLEIYAKAQQQVRAPQSKWKTRLYQTDDLIMHACVVS